MKQIIIFLILVLSIGTETTNAQYTNNTWCFGDSSGIRFGSLPTPFISGVRTKSGSAEISDQNGDLLFYCYGYDYYLEQLQYFRSGIVKNKLHQTMSNGDSLIAEVYRDMIIIPKSVTDSTFYLFSAGVTRDYGLWYNIIDLKQQNGLGAVIQKNIQLENFPVYDGLTAVKNGNGKDWWLICQRWDPTLQTQNNEFYVYKVDSTGISSANLQHVGTLHNNGAGDLSFNTDGTKLAYAEWKGMVELYDFNRCTGIISNPTNIEPETQIDPFPYYFGAVFSPNNRFLYLDSYQSPYFHASFLYQYDLTAPNIFLSKTLIDSFAYPTTMDCMEMGPDHKIYMTAYDEHYDYPYPDSVHNYITNNLSVINFPDSLGSACDFQPFSFYLGGQRTTIGLANNPDYTLSVLVGSPCDTLTAVNELTPVAGVNELKVFYHSGWDIAFINADKLAGRKYMLSVFDITGKLIFQEEGSLNSQYFTKDLGMQGFAKGIYIAVLETDKERLNKRFVKY